MATKGRTTQGGSLRSVENRLYAREEAFDAGDEITMVSGWVSVDTGAHTMRGFVYNPSTGARLAQSGDVSVGVGNAVANFALSYTIPSSGNYAFGIESENVGGTGAVYYDATGAVSYYDADASNSYPPPVTWTGMAGDVGTDNNSIYATYTPAGGAAPTITDVDGDNIVTSDQTNVVITGTNFSTATVDITQATVTIAQSIDSQDATTITFDMVFESTTDLKFGAATLTVENADTQSDDHAITINPPTGNNYVDLTSVEPVADNRITAIPDLEAGDQLEWGNVQGGTIADVTVNNDATFDCDEAVTSFDVRAWSATDEVWGEWATQDVSGSFATSANQQRDGRRRGMLIPLWGRG